MARARIGSAGIALAGIALAGCGDAAPVAPVSFDENGTWAVVARLPEGRVAPAAAVWRDQIYIVGGYPGQNVGPASRTVYRFDPATNQVTRLADFPEGMAEGALAVYRDTLLAIGGNTDLEEAIIISAKLRAYDPGTDDWADWAAMPEPRYRHAAIAAEDRLHVLGGEWFDRPPGDSIVVFDGRARSFGVPPTAPFANPLAAGPMGRSIAVMSSLFEDTRVLVFDPVTETWSLSPRSGLIGQATGSTLDGRFHAFGRNGIQRHLVWGQGEATWRSAPPPTVPVQAAASVEYGGRLYLIGGLDLARQGATAIQAYTPPS